MLTAAEKRNVASSSGQSQGFTIKAGAKAFQILRDSLYSRKEEAICRETFTNAYDAHLMVGKEDQPFEVTFPTLFDSTFRVRDFGPGMDHDFMVGDYTVAFHSTKDQTNSQVGGFGLGRMSAFSYTDTYSVTVWQNGKQRFYSLLIGEEGVPECHFLGEQASDQPDGTEVSFPIKRSDIETFASAMRKVVLGFDVPPKVLNQENPWYDLKPDIDKGWYRVYKDKRQSIYGNKANVFVDQHYAKMGCVLYPISNVRVDIELNTYDVLIIDFPIGSLAVSASREELSYGDKEPTRKTITEFVDRLNKEFKDDIKSTIESADTYQEAQQLANKFSRLVPRATWGGQVVEDTYLLDDKIGVAFEYKYHIGDRQKRMFRGSDEVHSHRLEKGKRLRTLGIDTVFLIDTDQRIVRMPDRMTNYYNSKNTTYYDKSIAYIKFDSTDKDQMASIQDLMFKFPAFDYVDVSALPDPGPKPKGTTGPIKVKRVKLHRKPYTYQDSYLEDINLSNAEFKAGGVYVRTKSSESEEEVVVADRTRHLFLSDIDTYWPAYARETKTSQEFAIAVPKTIQKRFLEAPQWKSIEEAWTPWLNTNIKAMELRAILINLDTGNKATLKRLSFVEELKKICDLVSKATDPAYGSKEALVIGTLFYHKLRHRVTKVNMSIDRRIKAVYSSYPLLKFYNQEGRQDFIDYYNLMKEKKHEQV